MAPLAVALLALVFLWAASKESGRRASPDGAPAPIAAQGPQHATPGESPEAAEDLAIAMGVLLDSPRPKEAVEEGLRIAELLRQRYGIDTENRYQDRMVAARRAKRELIDQLDFKREEVERKARSLGYSLEPSVCVNSCEQVYRLAILELQKEALKVFAEGQEEEEAVPAKE